MAKPRIFIDASPLLDSRLSGIGHTVLSMIRTMSESPLFERYELCLVVPYLKRSKLERFHLKNVRVKTIVLPARVWNVWPRLPLMPPIDLFLGTGVYVFMNYKKWPLLFSKSITYVYDANYAIYPQYVEARNLRMLQGNLGRWMARSDKIVTISEASKAELIKYAGAPRKKIEVIYCGVDTDFMRPAPKAEVSRVVRKYGITKKYLMFLSNIEPRKNIENLLEALRLLPEEYKKTHALLLVGGMAWSTEAILAKIDAVKKEGWDIIKPSQYVPDEDLPALLTGAELLVHPAFHEGFGISPLQAMACGTPVAVSDLPVMQETVGKYGTYFDPHDPASISEALHGIMTRTKSQKKADVVRQRVMDFTWEKAARKLSELVGELR